jgi:phage-related minor tail protein
MASMQGLFGGGLSLPLPGSGSFIGPAMKASGGLIQGPGTGRSDSIHARVSNGEFIINSDATSKHRALLEAINSGSPKFASGGLVGGGGSPGSIGGGNSHIVIAPSIAVTVQGSPGQSPQDHQRMGETIAKAAQQHIQRTVGDELRKQIRPGGILRR